MEYKAYKMQFTNGVHLGKTALEDSEYSICADTIFSALCQEALKQSESCMNQLVAYVRAGAVLFSDAFPYMGDRYYVPKPRIRIETENQGDSKIKKAYKKLKYIPADLLTEYLNGKMDVQTVQGELKELGFAYTKTSASVRGETETVPYRVGVYQFRKGNGLYLIVGYQEQEQKELVEDLLTALRYTGIGGKRSSGLGRFELEFAEINAEILKRLQTEGKQYMTLSVSLPEEEELEHVLEKASYQLVKRSGFVASATYADEYLRKKDLFVFEAGTCVEEKYQGNIYDVSNNGGHAVYRYAKPMFLEVSR